MHEEYFVLSPEVAGGFGPATVLNRTVHPPIVQTLEYEFEGWLGDDLLETFPCFIVSERLATALRETSLNDFVLENVRVTRSPQFAELYPDLAIPPFFWLKPKGTPGVSDLALASDASLVVSRKALEFLRRFSLAHCTVRPWPPN